MNLGCKDGVRGNPVYSSVGRRYSVEIVQQWTGSVERAISLIPRHFDIASILS